ncbi:MAG: THUMP domain-containing protein [Myxococcota bacterium]|nr:THUMP domain-containing protein [Myxococcota bacterium]
MITDGLLEMFATCDTGLEELLREELESLGAQQVQEGFRGVSFQGPRSIMWRANLCSRVANRILVRLRTFRVEDRPRLYGAIIKLPWETLLRYDQTIAIDSSVHEHPTLHSFQLVNQVVKDAICDRFRKHCGMRPSVDRSEPDIPIHIRLEGERAQLFVDTSGARLHRRGYRTEAGKAPLRETLASAMLLWSGYDGSQQLIDPFCGSGTILIEAALIARRIAPGLLRLRDGAGFAFQRWVDHPVDTFQRIEDELRERIRDDVPAKILGADIHPGVLARAQRNAERAWVRPCVQLASRDACATRPPHPTGLLVTNPPYGERLGEFEQLMDLMSEFATTLKHEYSGWTAHILMSDPRLLKQMGLKPSRKRVVHNGPIECRFATIQLYAGSRRT